MRTFLLLALLLLPMSTAADVRQDRVLVATPIMRVVVSPEKFDKRRIRSIGFVAIERGQLRIFPSRDSFLAAETAASIHVLMDHATEVAIAKKFNRKYVDFLGDFSLSKRVTTSQPFGELRNFVVISTTESSVRLKDKSTNEIYSR
jgi:hypothetical protein